MKAQWVAEFIIKLYEYHGPNYKWFLEDKNYPLQLAVAYFDWAYDEHGKAIEPEYSVEEAFERYLESLE